MDQFGTFCKRLIALLIISAPLQAAYFPTVLTPTGVTASTVAVVNGATPLSVYVNNPTTATVSGTVAATQSGTWNVNSTPVGTSTVTFNGVAQPVTATISGTPNVYVTNPTSSTIFGSVTVTPGTGTFAVSGSFAPAANQPVSFSTTTITAVLSSTAITTNVSISTPIVAVAAQTVRVYAIILSVDSSTNITFRDGATLFGSTYYLTASGSIVLDPTNFPWYITSSGNGFVIQQSGTANIGVRILYTQS